jgi:hypothetical protein
MALHAELEALLDGGVHEEAVHVFLAQHSEILLRWCGCDGDRVDFRSKIDLHAVVPDFAVGVFRQTTSRWQWTLIEIERPDHLLFSRSGDPTRELNHAIRQVTDWRAWLQNNIDYARTLLPDITPTCDVCVIIGRRNGVPLSAQDRLEMLQIQSPGLRIGTFDSVLDVCRRIDEENK